MSGIDELLAVARAYAAAEEIPLTTVSWRVFEDTKKLPRLVAGADIQSRRLEKAMLWFSANWPAAALWPPDVSHPTKVSPAHIAPRPELARAG